MRAQSVTKQGKTAGSGEDKKTSRRVIRPMLLLGSAALKSNFTRLSMPYKLTLVTTYNCNHRCMLCGIWKKKPTNELSFKEIDTFFKKNNQFLWVDLTGGEIFIRPDIVDIVKSVRKHCKNLFMLHFATNGVLTSRIVKGVEEMSKLGIPKLVVTVSLDGPKDKHDVLRGFPGAYTNAVNTFKGLKKIPGVEVVFGMTLSNHNIHLVDKTFNSLKRDVPGLKRSDMHYNVAQVSGHYYDNKHIEKDISQEKLKNKIVSELTRTRKLRGFSLHPVAYLERKYQSNVRGFLKTGKSPMPCAALSASCFIDSHGKVYPCVSFGKLVGDLRKTNYDLKKIWNSKHAVELQRQIRKLYCPQCWTPCEAYQTILSNIYR